MVPTSLCVCDHEVCEPFYVATSLEHDLWCDGWAFNLKHILLEHEMLAPGLRHVGLDCTTFMMEKEFTGNF